MTKAAQQASGRLDSDDDIARTTGSQSRVLHALPDHPCMLPVLRCGAWLCPKGMMTVMTTLLTMTCHYSLHPNDTVDNQMWLHHRLMTCVLIMTATV